MNWNVENLKNALGPAHADPFLRDAMRETFAQAGGEELFGYERIRPVDECAPFPAAWTGMEIGLFDNGPVPEPKRKRGFIRTQSTRFKLSMKVWNVEKINFSSKQIEWQATVPLWTRDEADAVIRQLSDNRLIQEQSYRDMRDIIAGFDGLFGIPRVAGQKWADDHYIACSLAGDGNDATPSSVLFLAGDRGLGFDNFAAELANGSALQGKAIGQMRVANGDRFEGWATHFA